MREFPKMQSGYAHELNMTVDGKIASECRAFNAKNEEWDMQVYSPNGKEKWMGNRRIDGFMHNVWLCDDGFCRAQHTTDY